MMTGDAKPPTAPTPMALAPEHDLGTDELFARVVEDLRHADPDLRHIVVLHQRPTRYVLEQAIRLTRSTEPHGRIVGLRILRELGPAPRPVSGRRTFVKESASRVSELLRDPDEANAVISWAISVAGYLADHALLSEVLDHLGDREGEIRFNIAAALPSLVEPGTSSDRVRLAIESLCQDPDPDTRYYALHAAVDIDIASSLDADVVSRLLSDPDEQVRRLASEAWHAATDDPELDN